MKLTLVLLGSVATILLSIPLTVTEADARVGYRGVGRVGHPVARVARRSYRGAAVLGTAAAIGAAAYGAGSYYGGGGYGYSPYGGGYPAYNSGYPAYDPAP